MSPAADKKHDWQSAPIARLAGKRGRLGLTALFGSSADNKNATDPFAPGLIGLQPQQNQLLIAFAQHLAGFAANHVLIYGPRGCGKSSLVAAAVRQLVPHDLKVVETDSHSLAEGKDLLCRQHPDGRFVVFLDDWGFDDSRSDAFRALKSLLEGALQSLPERFLLCATANRRHLVPEPTSDNAVGTLGIPGEIHPQEASQEQLALADRFGLWIRVAAPNQREYLQQTAFWLNHLTQQAGMKPIDLNKNPEIAEQALAWATARGQRSGRAARQFAIALVGRERLLHKGGFLPELRAAWSADLKEEKVP